MTIPQAWSVVAQTASDFGVRENSLGQNNFQMGLRVVFGLAGGIALIIVIYAGFQYIASQGNPQATSKAKNTIIDALIGLALIVASFGIISFVTRWLL